LRCLVIIDLKLDKFTHADAGQMHLYLNYAHEHAPRGKAQGRQDDGEPSRTMISRVQSSKRAAR